MRLLKAVLFVTLTSVPVLADDAKPSDSKPEVEKKKVPFRVVKIMPDTQQALLLDQDKGTHVVAEVGQTFEGYRVEEIGNDTVTLSDDEGAETILTAPTHHRPPKKAPAKPARVPVDPYADAGDAKTSATPVDPYAEPEPPKAAGEGGVRVASAAETADDTDPGIAAFAEAVGATPAPAPATKTPVRSVKAPNATPSTTPSTAADNGAALAAAATGSPAPAATASATAAPTAATGTAVAATPNGPATPPAAAAAAATPAPVVIAPIVLARSELDTALADFHALAGSFRATFTPDGLRFDTINDGSILTKLGLRKGDVIVNVDGRVLRTLDDAAALYARAGSVRNTTIQLTRAGKPVTLRVTIP